MNAYTTASSGLAHPRGRPRPPPARRIGRNACTAGRNPRARRTSLSCRRFSMPHAASLPRMSLPGLEWKPKTPSPTKRLRPDPRKGGTGRPVWRSAVPRLPSARRPSPGPGTAADVVAGPVHGITAVDGTAVGRAMALETDAQLRGIDALAWRRAGDVACPLLLGSILLLHALPLPSPGPRDVSVEALCANALPGQARSAGFGRRPHTSRRRRRRS